MASLVDLQASVKKSLQHIQIIARNGKELFRVQLQKKICKEISDSDDTLACLKARDFQNLMQNHVKAMISSWSLSASQLSEEIDRRVQKL